MIDPGGTRREETALNGARQEAGLI